MHILEYLHEKGKLKQLHYDCWHYVTLGRSKLWYTGAVILHYKGVRGYLPYEQRVDKLQPEDVPCGKCYNVDVSCRSFVLGIGAGKK